MASNSKSLTVIDATDAVVLSAETPAPILSAKQTEELDKCEFHLHRLGPRIAAREVDLIYLYVEAGWWLMRAQAIHRVSDRPTDGATGRFVAANGDHDTGFQGWLKQQPEQLSRDKAYRWIQGARNCGLTPESNILALNTLKEEKKLHGKTLDALCRKPVDKEDRQAELHELTDEERAAEEEAERIQRWETLAAQLHNYGIEADEWAKLDLDRRAGLYDVLSELTKRIKPSLRKPKRVPALPAPGRKGR